MIQASEVIALSTGSGLDAIIADWVVGIEQPVCCSIFLRCSSLRFLSLVNICEKVLILEADWVIPINWAGAPPQTCSPSSLIHLSSSAKCFTVSIVLFLLAISIHLTSRILVSLFLLLLLINFLFLNLRQLFNNMSLLSLSFFQRPP
ncbi:hypothetical protein DFH27DRAFT_542536 [Peziza echinospora]|nr:hypothetical protein DFH27DRAFT_542536 [Peziza echinospora]